MVGATTIDDAIATVLASIPTATVERVPIAAAGGRVLVENAVAPVDLPLFPSSSMDGFAVRAADTPGVLRVVGEVAAGRPSERALGRGEALAISTGGVVPASADAVVPVEHTERNGDHVTVGAVVAGAFVRPRGGDVAAGALVVPAGASLTAARLAALAACGIAEAGCGARPRVAIISTGTELRHPGETLRPGEIYESNGLMLEAVVKGAGATSTLLGSATDEWGALCAVLEEGLEHDVLVTSGGVSVGPHDLVPSALRSLGVSEVFHGVAMRPGKPVFFGLKGRRLVFGLPGNPVSSLAGALLMLVPALRALQGASDPGPRFEVGVLDADVARLADREDFLRVRIEAGPHGGARLAPLSGQQSHMIVEAAAATALARVPRGAGILRRGSRVRYLRLGDGA